MSLRSVEMFGKCVPPRDESPAGGVTEVSAAVREPRIQAIEWVRVAAALGVIWFHLPGSLWKDVGQAGLVAFIVISVFFQARGAGDAGFAEYFRKRAVRIIPPLLSWYLFYGVVNLALGKEFLPFRGGIVADLLTGPWIELWFLPFIFLISLLVYPLRRLSDKLPSRGALVLWITASLAFVVGIPAASSLVPSHAPWVQWVNAAAAVPIGLSLFHLLGMEGRARIYGTLGYVAIFGLFCILCRDLCPGPATRYGIAVLAVAPAFLVTASLPAAITRMGGLCLGVYLLHPFVMAVIGRLTFFKSSQLALFLATALVSFLLTFLLRRTKWLRHIA